MNTRTRRAQQPRAQRRDELRQALLVSIEDLVEAGHSLAEVTVERMAAHAGISRANFYVYFQDRADVLAAWFDTVTDELTRTTSAWWQIGPHDTRDDLRAVFAAMVDAYRPHLTLLGAVHDTGLYDPQVRDQFQAFLEQQITALAEHIRAGQRTGFVSTQLPPEETAAWLALMAERMQRTMLADLPDAELDRHLDTYVDIVWYTLYA